VEVDPIAGSDMGEEESLRLKGVVELLEGDEFLTLKEAAELLRVQPNTVYDLMKWERVEGYSLRGWRFFRRTDIEQLLERRRAGKE
jgi:excisionase family DNA binding protein